MHNAFYGGSKIHSFKHSTMFILIHKTSSLQRLSRRILILKKLAQNQLCHCNVPPNHRPMWSLISQHHCHPRAGHDSTRHQGTTGSHIAKTIHSQSSQHTVGFHILLRKQTNNMEGSLDLLSQAKPHIKHTVIQLKNGCLGLPNQANLLIKHRKLSNRWVHWTYSAKPHFASNKQSTH